MCVCVPYPMAGAFRGCFLIKKNSSFSIHHILFIIFYSSHLRIYYVGREQKSITPDVNEPDIMYSKSLK